MRLVVVIAIITAFYVAAMTFFIRELKAHPSKEDRQMNQSIPLIISTTFFYAVCIIQLLRFCTSGALSLL